MSNSGRCLLSEGNGGIGINVEVVGAHVFVRVFFPPVELAVMSENCPACKIGQQQWWQDFLSRYCMMFGRGLPHGLRSCEGAIYVKHR